MSTPSTHTIALMLAAHAPIDPQVLADAVAGQSWPMTAELALVPRSGDGRGGGDGGATYAVALQVASGFGRPDVEDLIAMAREAMVAATGDEELALLPATPELADRAREAAHRWHTSAAALVQAAIGTDLPAGVDELWREDGTLLPGPDRKADEIIDRLLWRPALTLWQTASGQSVVIDGAASTPARKPAGLCAEAAAYWRASGRPVDWQLMITRGTSGGNGVHPTLRIAAIRVSVIAERAQRGEPLCPEVDAG